MTGCLHPVTRALRRFVAWTQLKTGYTEDQLRGGLQVSGLIIHRGSQLGNPSLRLGVVLDCYFGKRRAEEL